MYVRLAAFAAALLWAGASYAQDKTFTLTVTAQDLQVLSAGLDELQRKVSEPLVVKLQQQLAPQIQAASPAPQAPAPQPDASAPPLVMPLNPSAHPSF